jgi:hypothetical protein
MLATVLAYLYLAIFTVGCLAIFSYLAYQFLDLCGEELYVLQAEPTGFDLYSFTLNPKMREDLMQIFVGLGVVSFVLLLVLSIPVPSLLRFLFLN